MIDDNKNWKIQKEKIKIAFITKTEAKNKKDLDKQERLQDLIQKVRKVRAISVIYIISNFELENYKPSKNSAPIIIVENDNPTGPISINTALNRIKNTAKKPYTFLVSSKEVELKQTNIEMLITEINNNPEFLVVGYKFKIKNEKLNNELQGYYNNKNLIAYRIPWNTCAIWNYKLFIKYVTKFDEITSRNPFNSICVSIDGICSQTEHKGMEDGLAIAQASSNQKQKIHFKLLDNYLSWEVDSDYNRKQKHREKLARKDTVLRNFMAVRNYPVKDSENSEMK